MYDRIRQEREFDFILWNISILSFLIKCPHFKKIKPTARDLQYALNAEFIPISSDAICLLNHLG